MNYIDYRVKIICFFPKKIVAFLVFLTEILLFSKASAIVFERRNEAKPEFGYFIAPVPVSIPGVQKALILGFSIYSIEIPGIEDAPFDVLGGVGAGDGTKWFEGKDFRAYALVFLDVPLLSKNLTLSTGIEYVEVFTYPSGERGINSDPDRTYYFLGERGYLFNSEVSLYLLNKQLEFFYTNFVLNYDPYGYIDYDENFISAGNAGMTDNPIVDRYGVLVDDTDSRRDPRIGYRIQLDRWDWPGRIKEEPSYYQYDLDISGYIPLINQKLILAFNQFVSSSKVKQQGSVNKEDWTCTPSENTANPLCQSMKNQIYEQLSEESKKGKATSLGGRDRMRGYREQRFFDENTNYRALELRWYVTETKIDFDFFVEKGIFTGFQLAAFFEQGTVSPDMGSRFWKNFRNSYGIASRFLFNSAIIRADFGISDESSELTIWYGYPF